MVVRGIAAGIFVFVALATAAAQTASAPLLEPKPVFAPGIYETESRNSAFQDQPVKSQSCIESRLRRLPAGDDGAISEVRRNS